MRYFRSDKTLRLKCSFYFGNFLFNRSRRAKILSNEVEAIFKLYILLSDGISNFSFANKNPTWKSINEKIYCITARVQLDRTKPRDILK